MRLFEQGMELKYAGRPASHIDQGRHGRLPVRVLPRPESDERNSRVDSQSVARAECDSRITHALQKVNKGTTPKFLFRF